MFCQNCGAFNSDDAVFCESCGTKLEKDEVTVQAVTQKADGMGEMGAAAEDSPSFPAQAALPSAHKKVSGLMVALIVEAVVLAVTGYAVFSIGNKGFSAEQTAENYFVNVANSDWEKAYEKLDTEESEFINAEMFAQANQENELGIVNTYQVNETRASLDGLLNQKSSLGAVVTIDYRVKGNTENSSYTVALNKQADKKYFFFENWKVGTSNLICRDYSIYVPQGASVTVDGVLLDETYSARDGEEDTSDNMSHYVIPQIFYGTHTVAVSMEDRVDVADTVQIGYDNTQYFLEAMQWKDEALAELIQTAGEAMQRIYQAAIEGKNLNTIEDLFSTDTECMAEVREAYELLLSGMNEGTAVPEKISFSNIKGTAYNNDTSVEVSFEYNVKYTYEDWWSGERKEDSYHGSDEWSFQFVKENGAWVLTNLGCENLYY